MNNIKLLDCTIRDGGYVNNWHFTDDQIKECYIACSKSGVDYMEIGFRNFQKIELLNKYGPSFFCKEEYINKVIGDIDGCKIAVMVSINAFDIADFVPKSQSKINMVRVLMAYHSLKDNGDKNLDMKQLLDGIVQINKLIELGYEVTFNIGRIDKISNEQLYEICKKLSETKISYFIMADTYGSVDLNYIETLIPYVKLLFNDIFKTNIKIGFHAHDNMNNGTCKALYSLKYGVDIIDGCVLGYGRGSGNAKTELIMMDLNKNYKKNYNFVDILEYGDNYLANYKTCSNNLSYNIIYALSSYFGCHVTYAIDIIEKFDKMKIKDIYNIFKKMKEDNKNMFYYENLFMKIYNLNEY